MCSIVLLTLSFLTRFTSGSHINAVNTYFACNRCRLPSRTGKSLRLSVSRSQALRLEIRACRLAFWRNVRIYYATSLPSYAKPTRITT